MNFGQQRPLFDLSETICSSEQRLDARWLLPLAVSTIGVCVTSKVTVSSSILVVFPADRVSARGLRAEKRFSNIWALSQASRIDPDRPINSNYCLVLANSLRPPRNFREASSRYLVDLATIGKR